MGVTGSPKAVPAGERLSAGEEDNSQSQRNGREIGVRDTQKSHAGWGWAVNPQVRSQEDMEKRGAWCTGVRIQG